MTTLKKILSIILILLLFNVFAFPVFAENGAPTDTFTHQETFSGKTKTVVMHPVYEAQRKLTARSLGLADEFGTVSQIKCDEKGNLYILMKSSEIIMLDKNYNFVKRITFTEQNGEKLTFDNSTGFFVRSAEEFYIADSAGAKVVKCVNGRVEKTYLSPESKTVPADFSFSPTKVTVDKKGYLYVLSDGSYYGILMYTPDGEFSEFYGANTVSGSVLSTLQSLWETLTKNDIKRAKTTKKLPYQIIDICTDSKDFVYTCTGKNAGGDVGQIRMLSPGGSNILVGAEAKNFGETMRIKRRKQTIRQNFCGIATDENSFIYAVDSAYGLVYIYDGKCNLIAAFGGGNGSGDQLGAFSAASGIAVNGTDVLVADSVDNSVTVFKRTEYGEKVFSAQLLSLRSDYESAEPIWREVYGKDEFNRLALTGLAKASYDKGDYRAAMSFAERAGDKNTYSLALKEVRNSFVTKNWTWIFLLSVAVISGLTVLIVYSVKHRVVLIKNEKLRTAVCAGIHPFEAFKDIKYKGKGSVILAAVFTLLYFAATVLAATNSNFRYTSFDADTFNSVLVLVKTVGLVLLWTVSNWAVCILMGGLGRFKEEFIVTAYSTLPIAVYRLISLPLSFMLTSESSTLLSGLNSVAVVLCGIILLVGLMIIHDYTLPRVLSTGAISILFMILIVFVLFMIGILLSQFWGFGVSVFMEAVRL